MDKIICCDCGQELLMDELLVFHDDNEIWDLYNEGCTYFGHIIKESHFEELKNE